MRAYARASGSSFGSLIWLQVGAWTKTHKLTAVENTWKFLCNQMQPWRTLTESRQCHFSFVFQGGGGGRTGTNVDSIGAFPKCDNLGSVKRQNESPTTVASLRELQHYGFIVMTESGCLGVNGRGKAPHWRLTELGYMHEPPTKDFLKWDGELFYEQKSPKYYTRKKQNPVLQERTVCPTAPDIPVSYRTGQLPDKVSYNAGHINGTACPTAPDISRINHSAVQSDAPAGVVFQLPAVRPDSRAVDAYLATWATDVPALALDLLLSDFGLSGSAR
jgi:hypothetical protein